MHDQNKVEACRRPNRLYRYKSRGFPAVRTSTPVSVILKADQSRRALSVRGTLTTTSLQTEHFSSHLRSSLSNYPANELRPNSPQDLSSTAGIMSVYIRAHHSTASYGLDGKALCSRFIANILLEQVATHHSRFHSSDRLVLGVMWYVGRSVEKIIDPVSCICSDGRTAIRPSNRFTGNRCRLESPP
jgi:hypothetical protein